MHTLKPDLAMALQQIAREFNQGKLTNKKGLTQGPNQNWRPVQLARTTEQIAAATDVATPGSGTAEIYIPDPNSVADQKDKGYVADTKPEDRTAGVWNYVAREINVTNPFENEIANDTFITVIYVRGQWLPVVGSGSGGGDCCCTCVCVEPNLQHPGGFLTLRHWAIPLSTSAWVRASNDNGHIRVKEVSRSFSWNSTNGRWEYTLTTSDVDWRNDNNEISVPTTVTGSAYMDWTSITDPVIVRVDFDATGDIYTPPPPPPP